MRRTNETDAQRTDIGSDAFRRTPVAWKRSVFCLAVFAVCSGAGGPRFAGTAAALGQTHAAQMISEGMSSTGMSAMDGQRSMPRDPLGSFDDRDREDPAVEMRKEQAVKLAAQFNEQRQKQMAADTARLLELANELKAEMDKSTKDTLSVSVLRKAEEIEKLAHEVREKMKATYGPAAPADGSMIGDRGMDGAMDR